jgi:hypothetical protein
VSAVLGKKRKERRRSFAGAFGIASDIRICMKIPLCILITFYFSKTDETSEEKKVYAYATNSHFCYFGGIFFLKKVHI